MANPLAPKGGNDKVMTPDDVAEYIVEHFRPAGNILEPCAGNGAFVRAIRKQKRHRNIGTCEIDPKASMFDSSDTVCHDFLQAEPFEDGLAGNTYYWDWIITNPPWSQFMPFLLKSMEIADNVVFLCRVNAWYMKARQREIAEYGFGLVEILEIPQPKKPWPQTGFMLGAGWLRRGWVGSTQLTRTHIK